MDMRQQQRCQQLLLAQSTFQQVGCDWGLGSRESSLARGRSRLSFPWGQGGKCAVLWACGFADAQIQSGLHQTPLLPTQMLLSSRPGSAVAAQIGDPLLVRACHANV